MRCQHCYQELATNTEACDNCGTLANPPAVAYFYTSPLRFILFSLLTVGLYRIYWFYKNWAAIKKTERVRIYPFLRALFAVFFCSNLFERIYRSAKAHTPYKGLFSANMLASFFIAGVCIPKLFSLLSPLLALFTGFFSIPFVYLPLLLIQRTIRFHNSHAIPGYQGRKKLTKGEVILIVLVITWVIGVAAYHSIWQKFHAPNHTFSVMLPPSVKQTLGQKLPIKDSDLTIKYDYYNSKRYLDDSDYSIEVFTYPSELATVNPEEMLEDFLASAFSDEGDKVLSLEATRWCGYPALDFTAQQQDAKHVKGKIIAVGQTLYALLATYKEGNYNEKQYNKFIHSFVLH